MADDTQFRDAVGKVMSDITGRSRSDLRLPGVADFVNRIIDLQASNKIASAPVVQPLIQSSSVALPASGFVQAGQGSGGVEDGSIGTGAIELIAIFNGAPYYVEFNAVLGDPVE